MHKLPFKEIAKLNPKSFWELTVKPFIYTLIMNIWW